MTFSVLGFFILLRFLDYKPRYLYYISEVLFRDSCKSCKRNLGGGEGNGSYFVFIYHSSIFSSEPYLYYILEI